MSEHVVRPARRHRSRRRRGARRATAASPSGRPWTSPRRGRSTKRRSCSPWAGRGPSTRCARLEPPRPSRRSWSSPTRPTRPTAPWRCTPARRTTWSPTTLSCRPPAPRGPLRGRHAARPSRARDRRPRRPSCPTCAGSRRSPSTTCAWPIDSTSRRSSSSSGSRITASCCGPSAPRRPSELARRTRRRRPGSGPRRRSSRRGSRRTRSRCSSRASADGAESLVLSRLVEAIATHDARRDDPRALALVGRHRPLRAGSAAPALAEILDVGDARALDVAPYDRRASARASAQARGCSTPPAAMYVDLGRPVHAERAPRTVGRRRRRGRPRPGPSGPARDPARSPRTAKVSVPSMPERRRRLARRELQREDPHPDQVRAVDPLVALREHEPHAEERGPLRRPVAARAAAVLLAGEHARAGRLRPRSARRRRRSKRPRRVGQVRRPRPLGPGRELVAQPDVRERAAHHHLVVPAP